MGQAIKILFSMLPSDVAVIVLLLVAVLVVVAVFKLVAMVLDAIPFL